MAPAAASLAAAPLLLIALPLVRADPCTDAAAEASEQCCEGTGAYACFTTTRSYAEMCSIPECTAALEAGDEACEVSGEDQNPAKQAYNAMRQLVTCEGLDEECYGTVGDAMNTCQISSALDTDPGAWATVAQTVCLEPNCVEAMTQQVEQCGTARDPGTFLQVQMFEQLLGLCTQGQAAAGQVNAMRCPEEQLSRLSSACYADKAHTQMRCEDCLPLISQLAALCPISFADGEPLALASACSAEAGQSCPDIAQRSAAVTAECCNEASEDCTSGVPTVCNEGCAALFLPFMEACGPLLGPGRALYDPVVSECQAAQTLHDAGGGH